MYFFQLYCCFTLRSVTAGRAAVRACYVPGCPVHLYFDFVILLGFERNKWRWRWRSESRPYIEYITLTNSIIVLDYFILMNKSNIIDRL